MTEFTHLDRDGRLRMVEVGDKHETLRLASASCRVVVGSNVFPRLLEGTLPKGDEIGRAHV